MSKREQSGDLYRKVNHKEGTHLASSQDTAGTFRGTLYDDNNRLVGHAEWEKVDESELVGDYLHDNPPYQQEVELSPEMQKLAQAIGEILAEASIHFINEFVAPPFKQWWHKKFVPTMQKFWKTVRDKASDKLFSTNKKKAKSHNNVIVTANGAVSELFSSGLENAYEKYIYDMTSEEAQRELLDIFIYTAILIKKISKLSNARIIKNEGAPKEYIEGQKILERLTTPEYIISINQILENNPQLMEEKSTVFSDILGRDLVLNGQYAPIEIGMFTEAMALQVYECDDV